MINIKLNGNCFAVFGVYIHTVCLNVLLVCVCMFWGANFTPQLLQTCSDRRRWSEVWLTWGDLLSLFLWIRFPSLWQHFSSSSSPGDLSLIKPSQICSGENVLFLCFTLSFIFHKSRRSSFCKSQYHLQCLKRIYRPTHLWFPDPA